MRKLFLTIFMGLAALVANAQTSIKVNVPNVVTLDEQFTITFIIENARPSNFDWDAGEDFENLWGPQQGRSSSVQIINGNRTESSQTTYSYVIHPVKVGKFILPEARATVNGKEIYSTKTEIEVLQSGSSQSQQQSQHVSSSKSAANAQETSGPELMLALQVDRKNVVVGEPIKATIKLFSRVDVDGFESADFPKFNGFWTQVTEEPTHFTFQREALDGELFYSTVIREYVLIPQHAGTIEITPAELVVLRTVPVASYGLFNDYTTVRNRVVSDAVKINVKPLPLPSPASFAGGVGKFTVTASLSADSLTVHDAAHLALKVSGTGNIQLLETPKITLPDDMETYDPTATSNVASNGMSGSRVYEYPFIPRSPGEFKIGPIEYTYYDVDKKDYVTITVPPIIASVAESEDEDADMVIGTRYNSPSKVETWNTDIRHIDEKDPGLNKKGDFFVGSMLFWLLILVLIGAAFVFYLVYRKMAVRNADAAGMKHRKATKMALRRLKKAGEFLKKDLSSAYYEELHNAILGYVSDKLNMPVAELSKDRISEVLLGNGVSEAIVAELVEILDACEFARYAPSTANQSMASDYEKAIEVISTIDSSMKTRKGFSNKYVAVALLMLLSVNAFASDSSKAEDIWKDANAAYVQGDYSAAVADYEKISEMGLESPVLYYNTANAYFQQGNLAKAILFYERALKLDPSYSDAKYNLEYVNTLIQDKIDPVPEFFLKEWLRGVSYMSDSNGWAVTFIVLLAITLALVLVFLLARSVVWKRVGFFAGIVTVVLMFSALAFSLWQKSEYEDSDKAIVMRTVYVRSTPSVESSQKTLFELHAGTKVNILEIKGRHMKISIADGRQGWINTSDIEVI